MRELRSSAIAIIFLLSVSLFTATSAFAAEETLGQKILSGALSSAGSKGGEFAVKFVSGWIYNISCKPEQQTDEGSKAVCSALGGLSGKTEEEWKQKIEAKLTEISGKLGALESGQKQILTAIANQHKAMDDQFKQVPNAVKVTAILTTIDNFWGRFQAEIRNPKQEMNKTDMEKFARDVMSAKLHIKLGDLNSLLSHPIDNAQPLLTYPFYQFRQKNSQNAPPEAYPGLATYNYAEKKFMYYRGEEQKGYLVYLWAAEIIQGDCEIRGDTKCDALPITSTAFARDFDRYTRDQLEAFNSAAHGIVLAYSNPESDKPNILIPFSTQPDILVRLNYLTATILGNGEGAWGEVISADGDPWDGKVTVDCGGRRQLSPAFSYTVAADTRNGPSIDWWTSRGHNGTYDEVRFSPNWRIHHYRIDDAKPGDCKLDETLSNKDRLPWRSSDSGVQKITKEGQTYPFGFFYGFQRAGGTYAMASGQDWSFPAAPETSDSGDATKKETRFDWVISPNHHEGLWVSLLNSARVDHTVGKSIVNNNQAANVMNRIYAYNRKSIWFPDGGTVKLHLNQHYFCEKVCRNGATMEYGILDYDVENSPYEAGKMTAIVAVFLDPNQGLDNVVERAKNGMFVDGSYGDTKDRKTQLVKNSASGRAKVNPGQAYHLQYLVYFDLKTHSKRLDSTQYRFMGKITPMWLYLTK